MFNPYHKRFIECFTKLLEVLGMSEDNYQLNDLTRVEQYLFHFEKELSSGCYLLDKYIKGTYGDWLKLYNDVLASMKEKNIVNNELCMINDFANYQYEYYTKKRAYITNCLSIIKKFIAVKDSADDFELNDVDTILCSIARSLGFIYPPHLSNEE